MVVVSVLLGWLVAGRFLRPLRTITATARDISASNLHRRLGRTGRDDEFTELAATLDDLFARLEASFESQRHFVANASHELRTPLTAERTLLQVALADPDATADSLRADLRGRAGPGRGAGAPDRRAADAGEQRAGRRAAGAVRPGRARRGRGARPERGGRGAGTSASTPRWPRRRRRAIPAWWRAWWRTWWTTRCATTRPAVRVEVATSTVAGQASITVGNTGPVIPPDEVERLFQPFQRLGGQRIRRSRTATVWAWPSCARSPGPTARCWPRVPGPTAASTSRCASPDQLRGTSGALWATSSRHDREDVAARATGRRGR